jgi:lactoylglutathione lyase
MVLRYFGIRVLNLDASIDFYTKLLGLKILRRGRMYHGGKWALLVDPRSHQRLELNWYPDDSPYATKYKLGEELDHIGFRVQDAALAYKRLIARGVEPALVPGKKNSVKGVYYLKDPNGIWIEFYQ